MRCPYCGETIHDPGEDRFCPACGKEIPHQTPDERTVIRDRKISVAMLIPAMTFIILGGSFILPDIILRAIIPEMEPMFWPYDLLILFVGIALMVVRYPFARRSRRLTAVLLQRAEAMAACTYCGAENRPGSIRCESCGAPLNRN